MRQKLLFDTEILLIKFFNTSGSQNIRCKFLILNGNMNFFFAHSIAFFSKINDVNILYPYITKLSRRCGNEIKTNNT